MNRTGAAGRRGVPAASVVAFLDHYTVERSRDRRKSINGVAVSPVMQRTIRRYRNGQVQRVGPKGLAHLLDEFGFDLPWFHKWCKLHRKAIT